MLRLLLQNIFFAWPFFCIRVIVFSCENKGLKKGYMPVAPFVNFKEMEAYFFSSLCDAQSQSKKFSEHEIVLKMLNISTESSFIILLDWYSWLSFDESFGMTYLESVEKKIGLQ